MNELNDGIRLMSQGLDYIKDKIITTTSDLESRMDSFSTAADSIKQNMSGVTETLVQQIDKTLEQ